MRKILKIFKAFVLTSTISLSIIACSKPAANNQNYTDISNVTMKTINAKVNLNDNKVYDDVLHQFMINVNNKINSLIIKGKEAKYYIDYQIKIINHNLYDKVKKLELLDINIFATNDSKILKGNFKAKVNLVQKAVDISNINIDKQQAKVVVNTTTFQQAITVSLLLIEDKITSLVAIAKLDNDYVVNVEGHQLTESITKLDPVNINVNAIEGDNHFLLHGSFSFILVFTTV